MSISQKSCFASLPKTERGQPIVLGGDPKGKNFLYCHGKNVFIRDIKNPEIVDIYTEHPKDVTVAKYSPSGFYIASGDETGTVRIWDTVNKEHILKKEFQPLGGKIKDIDWSPDNTKLVLGGSGREKFATCINADTGTTVGNLSGHSKEVNSCSYKPTRPFRIATASEDFSLVAYEGPPFKNSKTLRDHSNFVNCVRYSPTGENFISGGADKKAFIYEGKTGDLIGELGSPAHKGGIYGISYNGDGTQVLTVSGDKTAKIWDVATMKIVTEFNFGEDVDDMQVGCLWQGDYLLTVSLSGFINYLDKNDSTAPYRIIKGHNKPITALALSSDRSRIYTGTSAGYVSYFNSSTGDCDQVKGKGHSNQVQGMVVEDDVITTVSLDDTIRETSSVSNEYGAGSSKLDSQPKGINRRQGLSVVACVNHLTVLQGDKKLSSISVKYEPVCVDIHPGMAEVAVGGTNRLVIYDLSNGTLSEKKSIIIKECTVGAVSYSPDGAILAEVGSDKYMRGYDAAGGYEEVFANQVHRARVCDVAWSPDSSHLATCSIDGGIGVWIPKKCLTNKVASLKDAHKKSFPNKIQWLDNNTVVTVGQDSNVKQYSVTF